MKTFSQLISEESVDSLDKLGHIGKYNNKRLKKLARRYPAFEDFDLEEWQGYPPPKNSSTETHNELRYLMSLGSKRKVWKAEMTMYDHKVIKPFKDYLELCLLIATNVLMWVGIIYLIKHIIMW